VSVALADQTSVPQVSSTSPVALSRGGLVGLAVGGIVLAVGGGILVATSDHLVNPTEYGVQLTLVVLGTVGAALAWLIRRPGNRLGWILLALAAASAIVALQGAASPLLHSIGVLADPLIFFLGYYAVFAFPDGRVRGRWEKGILAALVGYFLVEFYPWFFFSPVVSGGAPLADCNAACPMNPLMIANRPTIAASLGTKLSYAVIVIMTFTLICLTYRLITATRPRRRALVPVYIPALALSVPVLVFHGVIVDLVSLSPDISSTVGWFLSVGRTALPYGFLLAIVQTTLFAAAALKVIVARLSEGPSALQLRTILADALDEPSLELAFQVDHGAAFVDSSRNVIDPTPAVGHTSTPVRRNGETVAVIVHDDALNTDPELVEVAGHAVLLALENDRLANELQLTNAELRRTRARIVAAGDSERRKIERDLHDGAQQHLVALRVRVGLAGELADPGVARRLADVGAELEEILDELRDLAQGLYPPALRMFGLKEALRNVARRSATPTLIEAPSIGRYSEDVEAAVYFCCVESLQNVGKHAGPGARAIVRIWERDEQLWFEVEDDGVGWDLEAAGHFGTGHTNMTDRAAAVGGTIAVDSAPGRGTTVRGGVPTAQLSSVT
jgi:signal transduction histidine kinase